MAQYLTGPSYASNLVQTPDTRNPQLAEWNGQEKVKPTIVEKTDDRLIILTSGKRIGGYTNAAFFRETGGERVLQVPIEVPGKIANTNAIQLEHVGIGGLRVVQQGGRLTVNEQVNAQSYVSFEDAMSMNSRWRFNFTNRHYLYMTNGVTSKHIDVRKHLPAECQKSLNIWMVSAEDWFVCLVSAVTDLLTNHLSLSGVYVRTYIDPARSTIRLFFAYNGIATAQDIYHIYRYGGAAFQQNVFDGILNKFFHLHAPRREVVDGFDGVSVEFEPVGPYSRQKGETIGANGTRMVTFHSYELTQYRLENSVAPSEGFSLIGTGSATREMGIDALATGYISFDVKTGGLRSPKIFIGKEQTIGRILFEIRVGDGLEDAAYPVTEDEFENLNITLVFRAY